MLRLRDGTDIVVDGLELAEGLHKCKRTGTWRPLEPELFRWSYAALANAAKSEKEANARMVFLPNDNGSAAAAKLLPPVPFLIASKPLRAGEEVRWFYKWRSAVAADDLNTDDEAN